MAFKKKIWKDRLVEFSGRRLLKRISGSADSQMVVDVTRNEGTVSQAGDAFSAANMNDLEQRIADEFNSVSTVLTALNTNSQRIRVYVGSDGKLHFVNSAGADTVLNFSQSKVYIGTFQNTTSDRDGTTVYLSNYIDWWASVKSYAVQPLTGSNSDVSLNDAYWYPEVSYDASNGALTVFPQGGPRVFSFRLIVSNV